MLKGCAAKMFKQWGIAHRGIRNVVAIQILLYVIPLFGNTCMIKILSEFMSRWNPPGNLQTDIPPLGISHRNIFFYWRILPMKHHTDSVLYVSVGTNTWLVFPMVNI